MCYFFFSFTNKGNLMLKMKVVSGYDQVDAAIQSGYDFAVDPRDDVPKLWGKGSLVYIPANVPEKEAVILNGESTQEWQPYSDSRVSYCYFTEDDKETVIQKLQVLFGEEVV
jgi:hypothetical protein